MIGKKLFFTIVTALVLVGCGGGVDKKPANVGEVVVGDGNNNLDSSVNGNDNSNDSNSENTQDNPQTQKDTIAPKITLYGETKVTLNIGDIYNEEGAYAYDNVDGMVKVYIKGKVDTSKVGTYTITYTATDKAGNKATATREVVVKSKYLTHYVSNIKELRKALEDSVDNDLDDIIVLDKGHYITTSDKRGKIEFSDTQSHSVIIKAKEGLSSKDVILDGNNSTKVFDFRGSSSSIILKKITIKNANNHKAIYADELGNLTVEDCNFTDNKSGAIYVSHCNLKIENSSFTKNKGNNIIFNLRGNTYIENSIIKDNNTTAEGNSGVIESWGDLYIKNSKILNNIGNGVYVYYRYDVKIINSDISFNSLHNLYSQGYSKSLILNSNFRQKQDTYENIYTGSYAKYVVVNSNFVNGYVDLDNLPTIIINSIFKDCKFDTGRGKTKIYNSYLGYSQISSEYTPVKKNNLYPLDVGDIEFADDNITLMANSPLIDKGLNYKNSKFVELVGDDDFYNIILNTNKDINGNKRIYNETIDIGASEYQP